jgi:raffinose/stachyose/melibiose transport system permease protein
VKRRPANLLSWTGLVVIGLVHLVPFYLLVVLAFRKPGAKGSMWQIPLRADFSNFSEAWRNADLGRGLLNTAIVAGAATFVAAVIGLLAAYPLARRATRLNGRVYAGIVACMMVPNLTVLVPLYELMLQIGGINKRWAVILLQATFNIPIIVFLYAGALRTVPKELEDAAAIDGCGRYRIIRSVLLPLLKPTTSAVLVIVGVAIWNDFNFSVFFLQNADVHTVTVSLASFFQQYNVYVEQGAAGCLISVLPMVVVFFSMQKYFIKGLASGAIKS